jgi:radical SAM protein with 4Fe4S-binding SPASM domain
MGHPSFIQLYPTLRCNQDCKFCFNRNISGEAFYRDMTEKEASLLLDTALAWNIPEIDVLGGEPLLVPWMVDFIRRASDANIIINISTNGSLTDAIKQLAEMNTDSVNVGFSVLGFAETHNLLTRSDNFQKAVTGIKRMIAVGNPPVVKSVLMKGNEREIIDLVSFFAHIGVQKYYLLHEDIIGRPADTDGGSFPEFFVSYAGLKTALSGFLEIGFVAASGFYKYGAPKKGRCDAGATKIAVMPDGSVFPCNLLAGFREFCLGNIFHDDRERIWDNPVLQYFRNFNAINPCNDSTCSHHKTCTGGCPAHSYSFFHTMDAADPRCRNKA